MLIDCRVFVWHSSGNTVVAVKQDGDFIIPGCLVPAGETPVEVGGKYFEQQTGMCVKKIEDITGKIVSLAASFRHDDKLVMVYTAAFENFIITPATFIGSFVKPNDLIGGKHGSINAAIFSNLGILGVTRSWRAGFEKSVLHK